MHCNINENWAIIILQTSKPSIVKMIQVSSFVPFDGHSISKQANRSHHHIAQLWNDMTFKAVNICLQTMHKSSSYQGSLLPMIVVLMLSNKTLNSFSLHNTLYSLHIHRISPGSHKQYNILLSSHIIGLSITCTLEIYLACFRHPRQQKRSGFHKFLYILRPYTGTRCSTTFIS